MASEAGANGGSSEGLTPAQKLMEQHEHHTVTVEDVPDEEDILHPPPSATLKPVSDAAPALSEKAAGKQKAEDVPAPPKKAANASLNTADEELFPALGPVKPRGAATVAPTWGKKPSSVATNGANGANGTSRSSTPASGTTALPAGGPAALNLPGKDSDKISFYPAELTPRSQLKKPVNDIIRDINKRSKARLDYRAGGPGGLVTFFATGPKDDVRQSLKDIANEVAIKVRIFSCSP
jgi:hypothetical protein